MRDSKEAINVSRCWRTTDIISRCFNRSIFLMIGADVRCYYHSTADTRHYKHYPSLWRTNTLLLTVFMCECVGALSCGIYRGVCSHSFVHLPYGLWYHITLVYMVAHWKQSTWANFSDRFYFACNPFKNLKLHEGRVEYHFCKYILYVLVALVFNFGGLKPLNSSKNTIFNKRLFNFYFSSIGFLCLSS